MKSFKYLHLEILYTAKYSANYRMISAILLLAIIYLFFTFTSESRANYLENLPELNYTTPDLTEEEFISRTKRLEIESPAKNDFIPFEIRVPLDWKAAGDNSLDDLRISNFIFGDIFRLYSPARYSLRSNISVSAKKMKYEIPAKFWFPHYVISQGYSLIGMTIENENRVSGSYILVEGDDSFLVRATAITKGIDVSLAEYYSPLHPEIQEISMMVKVLNSFLPLQKNDPQTTVKLAHEFLDISAFDYPVDWNLTPFRVINIERMRARLVKTDNQNNLLGKIDVRLISTIIPQLEITDEIDKIKKRDLEEYRMKAVEEIGGIDNIKPNYPYIINLHSMAYKAEAISGKSPPPHEYWMLLLEAEDYYYLITMVTPARDYDFYRWAQNMEIIELVAESVRKLQY